MATIGEDKPKLIVCLSLPKTGTTYLESLMRQLDVFVLPVIKEPNYFFQRMHTQSLLDKIMSPGNLSRGHHWYLSQFEHGKTFATFVDLSTQYWSHYEKVIVNACTMFEPIFINIRRSRQDQLLSYLSHMRRGYLPNKDLHQICAAYPDFFTYLSEMAEWQSVYSMLNERFPDHDFLNIDFRELISSSESIMQQLVPNQNSKINLNLAVNKNQMGTPKLHFLNQMIFSNFLRKIGRKMPGPAYSGLIRIRKQLANLNLNTGQGRWYLQDKKFIEENL